MRIMLALLYILSAATAVARETAQFDEVTLPQAGTKRPGEEQNRCPTGWKTGFNPAIHVKQQGICPSGEYQVYMLCYHDLNSPIAEVRRTCRKD